MKYSIFAFLALGLGACTTVPGAVNDATRIGATAVYSAATIAGQVADGTANAITNTGHDVSDVVRSVIGQR